MCISRILLTTLLITCAVGQRNEDFCSYQSTAMVKSTSLVATQGSQWSDDDACRCVVSPNFNSSEGWSRLMTLAVEFKYTLNPDEDTPPCLPMLQVNTIRRPGSDAGYPLPITYAVCPKTDDGTRHMGSPIIYKGQQLVFHLYNPGRKMMQSKVTVNEFDGTLAIQCMPYERIMYEDDECPCRSDWGHMGGVGSASDFNEKRRLLIGLVTAFLFVAIIIAIIVGFVFYKRRRARKQTGNKEAVTVENKAYQGSKSSVTSDPKQPPTKDPVISYTPDPNLNLKLQQSAHHGSKDSGLASSNDNNDKRLPFMQPTPAARSLDNINALPENYPPLAGQGSTSSLDNTVDPVYVTRQQAKRPQPSAGPGPVAGQPRNYPSLAGQGSQSSLDHLPSYPGHVDDIYAKSLKRRPQQQAMSKSDDRINMENAAIAKDEQFHSAESLNASRVTIETDV